MVQQEASGRLWTYFIWICTQGLQKKLSEPTVTSHLDLWKHSGTDFYKSLLVDTAKEEICDVRVSGTHMVKADVVRKYQSPQDKRKTES